MPEEKGLSQEEVGLMPTPEQQAEVREREERFSAFQKKLKSAKRRDAFVEAANLLVGNLKNRALSTEQRSDIDKEINNLQAELRDLPWRHKEGRKALGILEKVAGKLITEGFTTEEAALLKKGEVGSKRVVRRMEKRLGKVREEAAGGGREKTEERKAA